jgi:hypothetical protein
MSVLGKVGTKGLASHLKGHFFYTNRTSLAEKKYQKHASIKLLASAIKIFQDKP